MVARHSGELEQERADVGGAGDALRERLASSLLIVSVKDSLLVSLGLCCTHAMSTL